MVGLAKNTCFGANLISVVHQPQISFLEQSRILHLGCHTNLRDTYSTEPSSKRKPRVRPQIEQQSQ